MPWAPQGTVDQSRFRESLTYEDKMRDQITQCLKAFNENSLDFMHSSVDALLVMVPVRLYDEPFKEQLLKLDSDWKGELRARERKHRKQILACSGGCPDVLDSPPAQPDRLYWEKKLFMLINLFDRRGIGLKLEKTDSI